MADEPISLTDIQKQIENIKKSLGDLKFIQDQLNKPRSVICKIINNTDIKLILTYDTHDHGGFATLPPTEINPRSAGAFGSQSSSGALFTGTDGSVHYNGGGMLLKCDWHNPWFGANSCEAGWERDDGTGRDDDTGRFWKYDIAGSGDQKAEMLFVISQVPEQYAWRFCRWCNVLFYDGYPEKGICPKPLSINRFDAGNTDIEVLLKTNPNNPKYTKVPYGKSFDPEDVNTGFESSKITKPGAATIPPKTLKPAKKRQHQASGWTFIIPHSFPPQSFQQPAWRFCRKCYALFFDGYIDNQGVCPHGGGHEAAGYGFVLTNDTPSPWKPDQQPAWRFCHKCFALFFDGYESNKGVCSAGGSHEWQEPNSEAIAPSRHFILNFHK